MEASLNQEATSSINHWRGNTFARLKWNPKLDRKWRHRSAKRR